MNRNLHSNCYSLKSWRIFTSQRQFVVEVINVIKLTEQKDRREERTVRKKGFNERKDLTDGKMR